LMGGTALCCCWLFVVPPSVTPVYWYLSAPASLFPSLSLFLFIPLPLSCSRSPHQEYRPMFGGKRVRPPSLHANTFKENVRGGRVSVRCLVPWLVPIDAACSDARALVCHSSSASGKHLKSAPPGSFSVLLSAALFCCTDLTVSA